MHYLIKYVLICIYFKKTKFEYIQNKMLKWTQIDRGRLKTELKMTGAESPYNGNGKFLRSPVLCSVITFWLLINVCGNIRMCVLLKDVFTQKVFSSSHFQFCFNLFILWIWQYFISSYFFFFWPSKQVKTHVDYVDCHLQHQRNTFIASAQIPCIESASTSVDPDELITTFNSVSTSWTVLLHIKTKERKPKHNLG